MLSLGISDRGLQTAVEGAGGTGNGAYESRTPRPRPRPKNSRDVSYSRPGTVVRFEPGSLLSPLPKFHPPGLIGFLFLHFFFGDICAPIMSTTLPAISVFCSVSTHGMAGRGESAWLVRTWSGIPRKSRGTQIESEGSLIPGVFVDSDCLIWYVSLP